MINLGLILIFFTDIIFYMIIFDVILSWFFLFGLRWRPLFLAQIIDPIYNIIGKFIPTTFGMFRFDALITLIIIYFIQGLLIINVPGLREEVLRLTSYI